MATQKPSKQSKLRKFIKAPIRILIKARDIYIKSMTECSDRLGYGTVMGCPTGQVVNHLPKSFSVNSTKSSNHDDDYRQLLRAASTRGSSNRVQLDVLQRQQSQSPKSPNTCREANHMPRSHSVGIGRIDEEKPCDFDEDDIKVITDVFPRSRSYAVSKTRAGVF